MEVAYRSGTPGIRLRDVGRKERCFPWATGTGEAGQAERSGHDPQNWRRSVRPSSRPVVIRPRIRGPGLSANPSRLRQYRRPCGSSVYGYNRIVYRWHVEQSVDGLMLFFRRNSFPRAMHPPVSNPTGDELNGAQMLFRIAVIIQAPSHAEHFGLQTTSILVNPAVAGCATDPGSHGRCG